MTADVASEDAPGGPPLPTNRELVRLELKEVPAEAARKWLRDWGGRRVPDRPDVDAPGVPRTNMPVTAEVKDGGAGIRLSFDASPTDTVELDVYPLARGASCVVASVGDDGAARQGMLGPQIEALVRQAQERIELKLQRDTNAFARDYHHSAVAAAARGRRSAAVAAAANAAVAAADSAAAATPVAAPFSEPPLSVDEGYPEPQLERAGAPGTAFSGGRFVDAANVVRSDAQFKERAFEMFESVRLGEAPLEDGGVKGFEGVLESLKTNNASEGQLARLFEEGKEAARLNGVDQLMVPLDKDLVQLGLILDGTGLQGGLDIFAGPPRPIGTEYVDPVAAATGMGMGAATAVDAGEAPQMYVMYDEDGEAVMQLTAEEMACIDEDELEMEMIRLDVLVTELLRAPDERFRAIAVNYRDVLLNDYYIVAMRARVARMESERERSVLARVNQLASTLVREVAMMGQALEMQQLEKIRTICEAAMEDMSRLPDKVRGMKPLLDRDFLSYLQHAIEVERGKIRAGGLDPQREPTTWLKVLGVIQRGVIAELAKDVYLDVQAISYVLRMPSRAERRALLETTIDTLPSMDVRGFRKAADNIVANIAARAGPGNFATSGSGVGGNNGGGAGGAGIDDAGDVVTTTASVVNDGLGSGSLGGGLGSGLSSGFSGVDASLRALVAEFGAMIEELLPEERVRELSAEADEAARQRLEGIGSRAAAIAEADVAAIAAGAAATIDAGGSGGGGGSGYGGPSRMLPGDFVGGPGGPAGAAMAAAAATGRTMGRAGAAASAAAAMGIGGEGSPAAPGERLAGPVPDLIAKYALDEDEEDDDDDDWDEPGSGEEWGSYDNVSEGSTGSADSRNDAGIVTNMPGGSGGSGLGVPPALRNAGLPSGVADDELGW